VVKRQWLVTFVQSSASVSHEQHATTHWRCQGEKWSAQCAGTPVGDQFSIPITHLVAEGIVSKHVHRQGESVLGMANSYRARAVDHFSAFAVFQPGKHYSNFTIDVKSVSMFFFPLLSAVLFVCITLLGRN